MALQIEQGDWLTCRICGGMRLLGAVRKIGRSPEEHAMEGAMEHSIEHSIEHSVSGPVVAGVVQSTADV